MKRKLFRDNIVNNVVLKSIFYYVFIKYLHMYTRDVNTIRTHVSDLKIRSCNIVLLQQHCFSAVRDQ